MVSDVALGCKLMVLVVLAVIAAAVRVTAPLENADPMSKVPEEPKRIVPPAVILIAPLADKFPAWKVFPLLPTPSVLVVDVRVQVPSAL